MVAPGDYVPAWGDAVWISFEPQAGYEQSGRRPALVLSPQSYNDKVDLALLCPITSKVKGDPFEVAIPAGEKVRGVVLANQIKSLDWRARNAEFLVSLPPAVTTETLQKVATLLRAP